MSVLVKGMEKPEHCGYCRFRYDGICHALQKTHYSMDECPLVRALPSAQQWIPVTERPPEFGSYVIVTTSWAFVTKAMYCGNHWEIAGIDYAKCAVIAWMPLPEPYKEERREE